jgi:hypothetical protein
MAGVMDLFSLPFVEDELGCSKQGAQVALPAAGSQAERVLAVIRDSLGMTDRQIADATGYAINIVTARRNSLVKAGFVRSGGVVDGGRGVRNTFWVLY